MDAEQLKERGNKEFAAKKWAAAASLYQQAIDLDPHVPMYYSNLAAAFIKMEKWPEGVEVSKKGLAVKSLAVAAEKPDLKTEIKLYWRLGLCQKEVGDLTNAKMSLEEGLKRDSNNSILIKELDNVKALANQKPEVVQSIPISIENTLPSKYYEQTTSPPKASASRPTSSIKQHSFVPPDVLDIYSLSQVIRCTPDELPEAYRFVFSISGATLRDICSKGIEYDLLDFLVNAALYVHEHEPGLSFDQWLEKTTDFLTELPKCPRFSLAKMLTTCDIRKLISLAQPSQEIQSQWA